LSADARAAAAAEQARLSQLGLTPTEATAGAAGGQVGGSQGRRFQDFRDLGGIKSDYAQFARPNGAESVSDQASRWASGQAASSLKASEDKLAQLAPEPIQRSFAGEKERYGDLALLQTLLEKRLPVEMTGGDIGGIVASSVASMAPGAYLGYQASDGDLGATAAGAATSFLGGMGFGPGQGATRTAARQWMGRRGSQIGANLLEVGGSALGRASEAIGGARAVASPAARLGGHEVTPFVEQRLAANPEAFGAYSAQLREASARGDLSTTIAALDESDPEFRQLLRRLR